MTETAAYAPKTSEPLAAPPFLVTTMLKSGWPDRGPDIFLGDWCFQVGADQRDYPKATVMPYPWSSLQARTDGTALCMELTLRTAKKLTPFFSEATQEEIGDRERNLLLVPALGRIIAAAYHNFVCLQAAVARYGRLRSIGLRREDYVVPETTDMLIVRSRRDEFQLQLFSELCPLLGISLELMSARDLTGSGPVGVGVASPASRRGLAGTARAVAKRILQYQARRADCILYNSSFSVAEILVLVLTSRMRVGAVPLARLDAIAWPRPAPSLRAELAAQLAPVPGGDPFEKALESVVPALWPISLLEGFGVLKAIVAENFPQPPNTIVSSMAWNNDDAFRLWCAQSYKRGSRLVCCQHGGGYHVRYLPGMPVQIEYRVADKFISWGGSSKQARACVTLPVPPHFRVKRARRADDVILYVGTSIDRWPIDIAHFPIGAMGRQYLDRQIAFWRALPPALQAKILLRCNPGDAGWSEKQRLRHAVPQLKLDDFSQSFDDRLRRAKLAVVDNLNTTLLQCLGSGVPTIVVWDPDAWATNDAASAHFAALEAAGVYFRCPKAAAQAVARVWPDPQKWWSEPSVAAAVNGFLDQYMKTDRGWIKPWLRELLA